ncbi:MAG TPA: hypothetical protein VKR58_03610 [Aquella sp.]|nr:hypothetical protein [Aquella sp.]
MKKMVLFGMVVGLCSSLAVAGSAYTTSQNYNYWLGVSYCAIQKKYGPVYQHRLGFSLISGDEAIKNAMTKCSDGSSAILRNSTWNESFKLNVKNNKDDINYICPSDARPYRPAGIGPDEPAARKNYADRSASRNTTPLCENFSDKLNSYLD